MSNFINVDKFTYWIMTKDEITGATYLAPKSLPGIVKLSVDPTSSRSAFYGDGRILEYGQTLGEIKVSLDISTVPLWAQADLLGHTMDGLGGMTSNVDDHAPYVAFAYRRKKGNGKYRYVKIYKGLFGESKDDAETATASNKFQNDSFDGVALPRTYDGNWRYYRDEDEPGYVDVSSTWFTNVDGSDTTDPAVSSSTPALNATAIAVTASYNWVFSESINPASVNTNNFYLVKDSDGSIVNGSVNYNDATKTVTFTPTANLSAASKYLAIADGDITDLAGNKLAISARAFTTA